MAVASDRPAGDGRENRPGSTLGGSPVPLYHRIYVNLRQRIHSGELANGELLPGEAALAREFGVSQITVRRALNELKAARLVTRERGRGTRVVHELTAPSVTTSMDGWLENIALMARNTEVRLIDFGYVRANGEVAEALGVPAGQPVQRAVRARYYQGCSLSHLTTYVPEDVGRRFRRKDLEEQPLLHLLERIGCRVSSARQVVSATIADPVVASVLSIDIGAPLLVMRRVVFDADRRPIEYIRALYRPDRYRYEMDLVRVHDAGGRHWVTGQGPVAPRQRPVSARPGEGEAET